MQEDVSAKEHFIDLCQNLARLDLEVGSSGNLSVKSSSGVIYITPSGAEFGDITQDNLSIIQDSTGDAFTGQKPSSDLVSHLSIYEIRKDVRAILHTHARPIVLSAMIGQPIPVLNTMHADYLGVRFRSHRSRTIERQGLAFSNTSKKAMYFF